MLVTWISSFLLPLPKADGKKKETSRTGARGSLRNVFTTKRLSGAGTPAIACTL